MESLHSTAQWQPDDRNFRPPSIEITDEAFPGSRRLSRIRNFLRLRWHIQPFGTSKYSWVRGVLNPAPVCGVLLTSPDYRTLAFAWTRGIDEQPS